MTLTMLPVLENGHEPAAVGAWTLEQISWWYLLRSQRIKARADANQEAMNDHDR